MSPAPAKLAIAIDLDQLRGLMREFAMDHGNVSPMVKTQTTGTNGGDEWHEAH